MLVHLHMNFLFASATPETARQTPSLPSPSQPTQSKDNKDEDPYDNLLPLNE